MTLADVKKKLPYLLIIVVALMGAFACGYYSRPTRVEEKDHKETTQKVETHADTAATGTTDAAKQKKEKLHVARHRVAVTEKKPDGTETTTVTTDVTADRGTEQKETEHTQVQVEQHVDQKVETHVEEDHSKLTLTLQPDWHVSVLAGLRSDFATDPHVIYGVEVEKRLVGPIYGGVWLMNLGTFNDFKLAGGVKASVAFP